MSKEYICGKNAIIEENVIIGKTPKNLKLGKTVIGKNATIHSGTIIYAGNKIGSNFYAGHNVLIRQENNIGNNVSIGSGSEIAFKTLIEDNVRIHSSVFIPEFTILRKNCWLGPHVVVTNSRYPASKNSKQNLEPVEIMENAKIGANSTILPGIRIGRNSVVGAGSVVTKNVPENSVYAGNPAKFLKKTDKIRDKKGEKAYG